MNKQLEIDQDLINQFYPYIYKEARRFSSSSSVCDFDDLEQAGYIGLMFANKYFDPLRNVKWATYAMNCIRNEIRNESMKFVKTLTLPHIVAIDYHKIKKLLNQKISGEKIKHKLGLTDSYFEKILRLNEATDTVIDNNSFVEESTDLVQDINFAYNKLDKKDREFLQLRLLKTYKQIGHLHNKTSEWARWKCKGIFKKIMRTSEK